MANDIFTIVETNIAEKAIIIWNEVDMLHNCSSRMSTDLLYSHDSS